MLRGFGQDGGFTLTVEQNKAEDKDPNWMPLVVFAGVAALMYFWWRP